MYSSVMNGKLSYYHDQIGLEVEAALHLNDGWYTLIEFKFGAHDFEKAAKNLNKTEELTKKRKSENKNVKISFSTLKIIMT